jgi:GNAT superfamily N-acetyltransferase
MEFEIRSASPSDAPAINALITPLAERFIVHEFFSPGREHFLDSISIAAIRRYFEAGFRYHVAEVDGVIVGVVSTRENSHLYHLFVSERAQGAGLARRLWQVARQASEAAGYRGDFPVNSSRFAVGFYEKLGFTHDGPEDNRGGVIAVPMRRTCRAAQLALAD